MKKSGNTCKGGIYNTVKLKRYLEVKSNPGTASRQTPTKHPIKLNEVTSREGGYHPQSSP